MLEIRTAWSKHKETLQNFFWKVLQAFGKQGINFIALVISAKLLSTYEFGIYSYIISIVFFLTMLGDFGISTATSKYVTEYSIVNKKKLQLVVFNSGLMVFFAGIVVIGLILVFGKFIFGVNYKYVLYILPLILLYPFTSLFDGIYMGLKRFKRMSLIVFGVGVGSIGLVFLLITKYGLFGAFLAQNLLYTVMFLALALGYEFYKFTLSKEIIQEIGKYALMYGLATLGYYLYSRVDILILGYFNYVEELGVYNLLNRISMITLFPFILFGQVVAPNFTRLFTLRQYKDILKKLKKYIVYFFLIAIVFFCVGYFFFPLVFRLAFNEYYGKIFNSMYILVLLIYGVNIYSAVVNLGIIVPTGYAKIMTILNLTFGVINIGLTVLFVVRFGYIGALYSTLISNLAGTFLLHIRYFQQIRYISSSQRQASLN